MSFMFRFRECQLDLRKYMRECTLPPLVYNEDDVLLPPPGHVSHKNNLSIRPDKNRRLETMYCINDMIFEALESWLEQAVPSEKVRTNEPDPYTGECLAIPTPVPSGYHWNLDKSPEDIRRLLPWLDRLPLITVQRILHLTNPDTLNWGFRVTTRDREPDPGIWSEYVWSPRGLNPSQNPGDASRRTLVAVQPPWILSESDMYEFVMALNFPPLIRPGHAFAQTHATRHRLWGKLWDSCVRHNTRYFVLTSYSHWVFGVFSPGWTIAYTSGVLSGTQSNPSIIELLSFWVASGMRLPGGYVAPEMAEPFYNEPLNETPLRQAYQVPEPADSESEWDPAASDAGTSAGVDLDIMTATDGGIGRSVYGLRKKERYPFIEDWIRKAAEFATEGGTIMGRELLQREKPGLPGLPFVVEMTYNPRLVQGSYAVGQWLTPFKDTYE
ncbi:hypothetical protein CC2G_005665 [Coprinopsis cinerea AmutBmut pab1-1]|nr:hypothetical protein CC2G_005665 [Coprinopsis cinerea AmutBmut pab1-1]